MRPAVACIGSKKGSLSLPHCARPVLLCGALGGGSLAAMAYCCTVHVLRVSRHMPERGGVHSRRLLGEIGGAVTFYWRRAAGGPWTVTACWCQVAWEEGRR